MGRRERLLDADAGPLNAFATDLRRLRRQAGNPPYRELGRRAGYSASALSVAASGHTLPSLDLTLAYAGACGADLAEWEARWKEAKERCDEAAWSGERSGDVASRDAEAGAGNLECGCSARSGPGSEPPGPSCEEAGTGTGDAQDASHGRSPHHAGGLPPVGFRQWLARSAVGSAVLLLAIGGWHVFSSSAHTGRPSARIMAADALKDGEDPYVHGCGHDQRPLERQPVYRASGQHYGWLIIFVSPSCSAAWGYVIGPNSPKWQVHIAAHRMADEVTAPSSFQGTARPNSWGNGLSAQAGCVRAEAWVDDGPRAVTSCWTPEGPVTGPTPTASLTPTGRRPL